MLCVRRRFCLLFPLNLDAGDVTQRLLDIQRDRPHADGEAGVLRVGGGKNGQLMQESGDLAKLMCNFIAPLVFHLSSKYVLLLPRGRASRVKPLLKIVQAAYEAIDVILPK